MNTQFGKSETEFDGVKLIVPFYTEDNRGYFLKNYEKDIFAEFGLEGTVNEDFESYSKKNVIRGLHFQTKNPQIKLVRVIKGEVWDVIVDLRKESPTFGQWHSFSLSDQNHNELWIPAGFAHGFKVVSDEAVMSYKCIGKYLAGFDTGIRWDDKELAINWNVDSPIVSEKDANLQLFQEFREKYQGL